MAGGRALVVGFVMLGVVTGCGSPEEADVVASATPVETADPEETVAVEETVEEEEATDVEEETDIEEESGDAPEVEATPEGVSTGNEFTGWWPSSHPPIGEHLQQVSHGRRPDL